MAGGAPVRSAKPVAGRGVKRDRAGDRHVQALAVRRDLDPHKAVAMFARQLAKPCSLGAENDAKTFDLGKPPDRHIAFGGKPGDMDVMFLQPFDRARKIDHADHRKLFKRPGGGAGQRA